MTAAPPTRGATRPRRRGPLLIAAAVALTIAAPAARAATNGRIAFEVPPDSAPALETINPDATGVAPVPSVPKDSANAAWSADGESLAFSSTVSGRAQIYVIKADGTGLRRVTDDPVASIDPTWSPDSTELAFTSWRNGESDIYVVDLSSLALRRLTSDPAADRQPRWSPDGKLIAFASNRSGNFQIFTMAPDGSNQRPLTTQPGDNTDPAWSPSGLQIAYTNSLNQGTHLFAIDLSGVDARQLTKGGGTDKFPAWSPDGTQIAFTRDQGLYAMPSSGEGAPFSARFLSANAVDPVWAVLPPPTVTSVAGGVTVKTPGSTTAAPASSSSALPTGTVVNATSGSLRLTFKPQAAPASIKATTVVVSHAKVKITLTARRPDVVLLTIEPRRCAATAAAVRRGRRPATVNVRHGHVRVRTPQIIAGSHLTAYTVAYSCRGTRVTVTKGVVLVTFRSGRHRTVSVRVGQSFFAPA